MRTVLAKAVWRLNVGKNPEKSQEQKHINIIVLAILRVFPKDPPVRTSRGNMGWDDSHGRENSVEESSTQVSDEITALLRGN